MLLVLFQLFQTRAQRVEGGGQGGDAVFSAPSSPVTLMQVLPSVESTLSQWARQSPIMAASRSWTPRSYSSARWCASSSMPARCSLMVEYWLGHGAELIILRAAGKRSPRAALRPRHAERQLIIGCIQRGTQGVAASAAASLCSWVRRSFSPRRVLTCVRSSCSCAQRLVDVALERLDAGGALRRGLFDIVNDVLTVEAAEQGTLKGIVFHPESHLTHTLSIV